MVTSSKLRQSTMERGLKPATTLGIRCRRKMRCPQNVVAGFSPRSSLAYNWRHLSGGSMNQTTSILRRGGIFIAAAILIGLIAAVPAAATTAFENLARLALPNARFNFAQMVTASCLL